MDLEGFKSQVLYNCDITDAHYSGIYSVCGLAMRLRDLYKWEQRLSPWQEDEPAKVLDWIGEKEDRWEALMETAYIPLELEGLSMDAFDAAAVNKILIPHGLFYGAGYAYSLKPTFFLADIIGREHLAGHDVWILGREHARDLLTLPAFSQDGQAILRSEASRMFLWDQIAYMSNTGRRALDLALRSSGIANGDTESIKSHFDTLWNVQKDIYMHHEVGELEETCFDRSVWREMLASHSHTAVELLIRALKDVLADTGPHGALSHLIERRNSAALGLYMAFGKGLIPMLCAELVCAFDAFLKQPDWERIALAAGKVRKRAADYAAEVSDLHLQYRGDKNTDTGRSEIEKTMVLRGLLPKSAASSGR